MVGAAADGEPGSAALPLPFPLASPVGIGATTWNGHHLFDQLRSSSVGPAPSACSPASLAWRELDDAPDRPLAPLACRDADPGLVGADGEAWSVDLVRTVDGGLAAHGGTHACLGSGPVSKRRLLTLVLRVGRASGGEVALETDSLRAA